MKRALLLLVIASPLVAQDQQAEWTAPAGWTIKTDKVDQKAADTKFQTMGQGYHVTSGPAAIYYKAENQTKGSFTTSASFGVRNGGSMGHPEAYGLFIGGSDLSDAAKQQYFYFLVRGDGKYFVAHRAGAEVHKIVDWTESDAVKKENAQGGVSQALSFQVTADSVHMSANGSRVKSFAKSELHGFNTDGQVGLRVNHMLNLHIGGFEVKQ
jgi:hypothetical protein